MFKISFRQAFSKLAILDMKDEPIKFLNQKYALIASQIFQSQIKLEGVIDSSNLETHLQKLKELQQFEKLERKEVKNLYFYQLVYFFRYFILYSQGRSNVGKSSLLNSLFGRNMAEISNYPGKTRQLFFYNVGLNRVFIDSPGYGFAKGNKKDIQNWGLLMSNYLRQAINLKQAYLLVDAEHGYFIQNSLSLKEVDIMTIKMLGSMRKPFTICFTKADKNINIQQLKDQVQKETQEIIYASQVLHFTSSKDKLGLKELQLNISYYCE